MAIFAGKQAGYADPTMDHETDITVKACAETIVFAGKQSGQADPTMIGCIPNDKNRQTAQIGIRYQW